MMFPNQMQDGPDVIYCTKEQYEWWKRVLAKRARMSAEIQTKETETRVQSESEDK